MTTYNTGNPLGSSDPRDLFDNAENLDGAVNSTTSDTWVDRLGVTSKTFKGMEREFNSAQTYRESRFNDFIAASGYQFLGDYGPGIEFTEYNQLVRDENGEFWRLSGQVELPYTTTGAGLPEDDSFTPLGDAVLRQELANPNMGASMVARGVVAVDSIADLLALPEGQRKEGLRYLVKGYHLGTDIGGGEFYWDQGSVSAANAGTVLGSGPVGRWRRKPVGYVSPEMFGAVCDGVASDVDAIQLAHDSLPPEGGIIKFSRDLSYNVGDSPVVIHKSNIKIDFNFCKLNMNNHAGTAFEVIPPSLIASGRKERADYPAEWQVKGTPYPFDGEWRTMMHEHRDAERVKNLVIRNCVTTESFIGTAFQIFSVDGVTVEDSNLASGLHSNLRFWHSTGITLTRNHFSGSGTYLVFMSKCRAITVYRNTFDSDETNTSKHLGMKGTYHGDGSVFLNHSEGYTDMSIDISYNVHRVSGNRIGSACSLGAGDHVLEDAVGFAGGQNIGFTRMEYYGAYSENIRICNNKHIVSDGGSAIAFSIMTANRNTKINDNSLVNASIVVASGQGLDIIRNEITSNVPSNYVIGSARNVYQPDHGPENVRIIDNKIDGHIGVDTSVAANAAMWVVGKNVEVSGNTLSNPGENSFYFAQLVREGYTDYVWGENNTVILGSSSTQFLKNRAVRTEIGANPNGGTVRCAVINRVTGQSRGVPATKVFGADISVRGSTTAGSASHGNRWATYYIINDLCFFHLSVSWTELTGTGGLQIAGMPLKVNNASNRAIQVFNVAGKISYPSGQLVAYMLPSEDFIRLATMSGSSGQLLDLPVVPSGDLFISGFYPHMAES